MKKIESNTMGKIGTTNKRHFSEAEVVNAASMRPDDQGKILSLGLEVERLILVHPPPPRP